MLNRYNIPFARWYAILVTDLPTSNLDFSLHVLKSHTCKIDDSIVVKAIMVEISLRLVKRSSKISKLMKTVEAYTIILDCRTIRNTFIE
jgi:hypothetical protein